MLTVLRHKRLGRTRRAVGSRIAISSAVVLGLISALFVVQAAGDISGVQPYQSYESTVTGDGPVHEYRFDDQAGSKSLSDSAGTDTAVNRQIALGGAGPFNGSHAGSFSNGSYATLASYPLAGDTSFTAEAWIYWNGLTSAGQQVFDFGSSTSSFIALSPGAGLPGHPMLFEIRTANFDYQVKASTMKAKTWEYVVVSEDSSGKLTLYLNGAQVAQTAGVSINPSSLGAPTNNWLGRSLVASAPAYSGGLSNLAFYPTALSASQILAHYDAGELPVSLSPPAVTGTAQDGQTLSASSGTWTGLSPMSNSYQWQSCDQTGSNCSNVSGATGSTYRLQSSDVGTTLRVVVTTANSAGSATASSGTTPAVAGAAPANSNVPSISGTAQDGQALTASAGSWSGTPSISYSYQWQSCDQSGSNCSNVSGATGSSYQLGSGDVGTTLVVVVTASNGAGSSTAASAASAVVVAAPPSNTALPNISGTAQDGQTLTASAGSWSGTPSISYTYRWQSCDPTGNNCGDIAGGTGATYQLGLGDIGTTLVVVVTASNGAGSSTAASAASGVVVAAPPSNTALPSISGTAQDGQTLTANPGSWTGKPPLAVGYQWQSCDPSGNSCVNVPGATQPSYALGPADVDTTLVVVVTASNAGGSTSASSAPSANVVAAPPANLAPPSVLGRAEDGQLLTASVGTWSGTPPLSDAYQWQSCDQNGNNCANIAGATGPTYQLGPGDVGTTVVVVVTASNSVASSSSASTPSAEVLAAPPANIATASISGTAQDGQLLTANVGSWTGTPPLSYSYQWQSCDPGGNNCAAVAGATAATYALGLGDVGTTLQVVVTASNSSGSAQAVSATTPVVIAVPPSTVAPPLISGLAQIGQTLTADTGMWSGDPVTSYSYQWQDCDLTGNSCWNIAGATGSSYQIPTWEVNETVQVTVTAVNSGGAGTAASLVTQPVGGTTPAAPVYFPASVFAQPIPANAPLDSQSPAMAQQLMDIAFGVAPTENYDCRQSIYIPWTQWNADAEAHCHQVDSRATFSDSDYSPTFYVAPAGEPTVSVQIPTNVNLQAAMQAVPIPPGAFPAPGTDGQMIIYQPSSDTMWQLWRAYQANGQWYASAGGRIQHVSTDPGYYQNILNTNNSCSANPQVKYCEQVGWGGAAASVPLLAGLMTIPQLQSGQINHAIMLALPDNAPNVWSWPAQHTDGTGGSSIPEGAWFRIDPSINLDAWFASLHRPIAPIERIVAKAMQTYGAVVVNTSTSLTLGSENWTVSGQDVFDGSGGLFGGLTPNQFMTDLPWESMQLLQTSMCNAVKAGSVPYQTACTPPSYVTPSPTPPNGVSCPATLSVSPQPGQTAGPSVTITDPTWTYVGTRVPVNAAVTDPSGVTEVDFKIDGQLRFVSNYPTCGKYVFGGSGGFWDAESEPTFGWHTIEVDAYDSLGYESTASERVYGGG